MRRESKPRFLGALSTLPLTLCYLLAREKPSYHQTDKVREKGGGVHLEGK